MSDSLDKIVAEARKRAAAHRNAYREHMMNGGSGNHSGQFISDAYVWMCNELATLARQHREEVELLRSGIVPRGTDMIVPVALLDEINATGSAWKDRAERAEAALGEIAEATKPGSRGVVNEAWIHEKATHFTRTSKETSNG